MLGNGWLHTYRVDAPAHRPARAAVPGTVGADHVARLYILLEQTPVVGELPARVLTGLHGGVAIVAKLLREAGLI